MSVPRIIIGTLVLFSIALNFANVIGRYVFLTPIIWAEEVMIFIMVWCVFMGAILVSWDGQHLKMDLVSAKLKAPLKQIVNGFALATFLIACGFVAAQSFKAVDLFGRLGQESTVAGIPMVIPHAALLIGFLLMTIGVAVRYREHVSGQLGGGLEGLIPDESDTEPGKKA
jgi:TRAP-type C4-dicarboxylate transport system permease small subunit